LPHKTKNKIKEEKEDRRKTEANLRMTSARDSLDSGGVVGGYEH